MASGLGELSGTQKMRRAATAPAWGTTAMCRARSASGSRATSRPEIRTDPAVKDSTPLTAFNSVDFPAPFGPTTATTSPACTVKLLKSAT